MPNLGPAEIFVILVVALIVFGPKKLPEIGRSLGRGLREFKKASNEFMNTLEAPDDDYYEPPRAAKENTDYAADSIGNAGGPGMAVDSPGSDSSVRSEETT